MLGGPVVVHSRSPVWLLERPPSFLRSNPGFCFQFSLESSPPFAIAMAPTKKGRGKNPASPPRPPPLAAPAEGLGKVSLALATIFNECGRTTAWPASHFSIGRIVTEVPYFADALWAGLVPPLF